MKTAYVKLTLILSVAMLLVALVPAAVCAADANELITIDFKDLDANAAIEAMFRNTGRNFAIDPEAKDVRVGSLSFKGVPFDTALKNLLKSAGLTYRMSEGIYLISKKATVGPEIQQGPVNPVPEPPIEVVTTKETIIDKVPLNHTGASEILSMMGADIDTNNSNNTAFGNYGAFGNTGGSGSGFSNRSSGFGGSSGGYGGSYGGSGYSSGGYSSGGYGRSW